MSDSPTEFEIFSETGSLAEYEIFSRSSSQSEFEIIDADPAPEVGSAAEDGQSNAWYQVEESGPSADIEESNFDAELESDLEETVPNADIATESPASEAEHQEKLSSPQVEDEVENLQSEDNFELDDIESVAAEIPEGNLASEAEVADESSHSDADVQFDGSDYTATCGSVASAEIPEASPTLEQEFHCEESATSAEIPEANPASEVDMQLETPVVPSEAELQLEAELDSCDGASVQLEEPQASPAASAKVGSSTRARRHRSKRGMEPHEVRHFADTMRQNASSGLSEAVRLIKELDNHVIECLNENPHVVDGAAYVKQQVKDDYQSAAKDMRDAFGAGQQSEPTVAATFSHFKAQCRKDFKHIRKDVDSAVDCKTEFSAAMCSLFSVAVTSCLVPVRLGRFAVANIAM